MQVRAVMNTQVRVVAEDMEVRQALKRMKKNNTGLFIVKDDHHVGGILSSRDVLELQEINKGRLNTLKVRDLMNRNVQFVYEDQSVHSIRAIMKEKKLNYLVVLNRKNKITGFCTRSSVGLNAE